MTDAIWIKAVNILAHKLVGINAAVLVDFTTKWEDEKEGFVTKKYVCFVCRILDKLCKTMKR